MSSYTVTHRGCIRCKETLENKTVLLVDHWNFSALLKGTSNIRNVRGPSNGHLHYHRDVFLQGPDWKSASVHSIALFSDLQTAAAQLMRLHKSSTELFILCWLASHCTTLPTLMVLPSAIWKDAETVFIQKILDCCFPELFFRICMSAWIFRTFLAFTVIGDESRRCTCVSAQCDLFCMSVISDKGSYSSSKNSEHRLHPKAICKCMSK